MNSRERLFAVLRGTERDRAPYYFITSMFGARFSGCTLPVYYSDPKCYLHGQCAVYDTLQPDIIFSPFILPALAEAFGGEVHYLEDQAANLMKPPITHAEQISKLKIPDIDSNPRLTFIRETTRLLKKELGDRVAIAGVTLSPFDLPIMIMGLDGWLNTVMFDPEGVKRMLAVTVPFFQEWTRVLREAGTDCFVLPSAFLSPAVVTADMVEQSALPILRETLANVGAPVVLHNGGAPMAEFLPIFKNLPDNVIGFAIDHQDDFAAARGIVEDRFTLFGGIDGPNMASMSADEVENQCRRLMERSASDPRFVLGTSGPDIHMDTPLENINRMRAVAEEY